MITAADILGWTDRADGALFAARGGINRAPREQRPDIATPAELEALKVRLGVDATDQQDFLNGPEFQKLFDTPWTGSKPMKYRAWREYRDAHPRLVLLWNGDEYPDVTRAIERAVPPEAREGMRAADLVRSHRDTSWCVTKGREAVLVYSMHGDAVVLDVSNAAGAFSVSWVDPEAGVLAKDDRPVAGGGQVTISPPAAGLGRPWVKWVEKK